MTGTVPLARRRRLDTISTKQRLRDALTSDADARLVAGRRALSDRYVVTLGALLCVDSPPFAGAPSRSFTVLAAHAGGFRVAVGGDAIGAVCDRIVIPPGIGYSVGDSTTELLRFLVEPAGNIGRRLRYALSSEPGGESKVMIDTARRLIETPPISAIRRDTWQAVVRRTFARIDPPNVAQNSDVALLRRIAGTMEQDLRGRVASTTLAARLRVPAEQLSRTLSRYVGLPLRPFVQWYRLLQYARFIERGDGPEWASRATGFGGWTKLIEFAQRSFGLDEADFAATERWSAAADASV